MQAELGAARRAPNSAPSPRAPGAETRAPHNSQLTHLLPHPHSGGFKSLKSRWLCEYEREQAERPRGRGRGGGGATASESARDSSGGAPPRRGRPAGSRGGGRGGPPADGRPRDRARERGRDLALALAPRAAPARRAPAPVSVLPPGGRGPPAELCTLDLARFSSAADLWDAAHAAVAAAAGAPPADGDAAPPTDPPPPPPPPAPPGLRLIYQDAAGDLLLLTAAEAWGRLVSSARRVVLLPDA